MPVSTLPGTHQEMTDMPVTIGEPLFQHQRVLLAWALYQGDLGGLETGTAGIAENGATGGAGQQGREGEHGEAKDSVE